MGSKPQIHTSFDPVEQGHSFSINFGDRVVDSKLLGLGTFASAAAAHNAAGKYLDELEKMKQANSPALRGEMPTSMFEKSDADGRQSDDTKTELFRPRYRPLLASELALHDEIKAKASELARLFAQVPRHSASPVEANYLENLAGNRGANVTLAIRHLEDAVYRAVKALTT